MAQTAAGLLGCCHLYLMLRLNILMHIHQLFRFTLVVTDCVYEANWQDECFEIIVHVFVCCYKSSKILYMIPQALMTLTMQLETVLTHWTRLSASRVRPWRSSSALPAPASATVRRNAVSIPLIGQCLEMNAWTLDSVYTEI